MSITRLHPYVRRPETRDAVLDAAGRLVRRSGYAKFTMVDLAHEAGLACIIHERFGQVGIGV